MTASVLRRVVEKPRGCGQDTDCDENADFCYQGGAGGQDNVCAVFMPMPNSACYSSG